MEDKENSKNDIIIDLYNSEVLNVIIDNITRNNPLKYDLKQELFLILLEMSDDKIIQAYENNYIMYMCISILTKQFNSNTSPFYFKYKYNSNIMDLDILDYNYMIDEIVNDITSYVNENCTLTDRELFKMYFKLGRYDRFIGELRDKSCEKPISSSRKISKKLEIKHKVPGRTKKVTISYATVIRSLNETLDKIKNNIRLDDYIDN